MTRQTPTLPEALAYPVRRMDRSLLVAYQDLPYVGMVERVRKIEHGAPWVTEERIDAFLL